jgi:hypothetical protein
MDTVSSSAWVEWPDHESRNLHLIRKLRINGALFPLPPYVFMPRRHILFEPVRVRVRVALRLAVYRQSVRLGVKSLETHDLYFFFQLNTCGYSPYVTSSLTRG